jgi:DNA polymerase-3 subunit beta
VGRAKAADLSAAIAQVAGAASTDPTLAALTCVHTALTEDGIVLTATDRYRVAQQTVAWEPVLEEGAGQQELLVPRPALERAAKSLTGTVSIGVQDGPSRALELSDGTRRVSTQLVDAEFVRVDSYRDRTIKDAAVTVTVAAADLTAAIGRVALFAERNTPIRVEVSADGLVVRASSDGDAGSEEVPAKVDGEHLVVALQANWLGEALAATRSDQVRLAVAHVHRPVLITPDADGDAYWQIVMPVRLGSAAAPGGES